MRFVGVLLAALVLTPAAGAWTTIGSGLTNHSDPAVISGPVVAYSTGSSLVVGNGDSMKALLSNQPFVGDPQLVRSEGKLLLFVGTASGVVWYTSNDGLTWSGPAGPLQSSRVDDVQAAAADGPAWIVSQDGTDFIDVWLNGGPGDDLFPYCCGYGESIAFDANNTPWMAFWSNATGQSGYLFGRVGGPYANLSGGKDTVQHTDRVPLATDGSDNVYTAWASGYPTADTLYVSTFLDGKQEHQVALGHGFGGGDPHVALAVDEQSRPWAAWSGGGKVHAAVGCGNGAAFGNATSVAAPGTVYALEIAPTGHGGVNAYVNNGSTLSAQTLLVRMRVTATKKTALVRDGACPVANALLHGGGKTVHTDAQGRASLKGFKRHARVGVTAPGYAPTSFRVP